MTRDVTGAEIIETMKKAKERDKPKKPSKRFNLIGYKAEYSFGSERIRQWFAGIKVKFPW